MLDFEITDDDIAETTEDIGKGMPERRIFSWEVPLTAPSPLLASTEVVVVVVVDKHLVLVVGGCLVTADKYFVKYNSCKQWIP